jgi:hypothetical protein
MEASLKASSCEAQGRMVAVKGARKSLSTKMSRSTQRLSDDVADATEAAEAAAVAAANNTAHLVALMVRSATTLGASRDAATAASE